MNNEMIRKYASNIEKNDILEFARKEGIDITESELNILYNIVKNESDRVLNSDFYSYIKKYKDKLSSSLYSKIVEKYEKYKGFIN